MRAGEPPMTANQRAAAPPVEHPVVRMHPDTGRKILYISRHVSHFAGMPRGESDALLEKLLQHSTQDRFAAPCTARRLMTLRRAACFAPHRSLNLSTAPP
jgi:alpha-ketoglutarate-dependent taurine dioxygenase